jgi:TolA-binding protein
MIRFPENTAMKTFRNRTVFAFALAALAAVLHTAPASAMGNSGTRTPMAEPRTQATERPGQTEAVAQSQIEALRKELAELKAQLALNKDAVVTK